MDEPEHRLLPDHPETVRLRMLHRRWTVTTVFRSRSLHGVWMYIAGRGCWNSKNWQKAAGRRWIERAGQPAVLRRSWAGRPDREAAGRLNVARMERWRQERQERRERRTLGLGGRFGSK